MYTDILSLLECPDCRRQLGLADSVEDVRIPLVTESSVCGCELQSGLLKCQCGATYPIIRGVPQLLNSGLRSKSRLTAPAAGEADSHKLDERFTRTAWASSKSTDYEYIRRSFSREWQLFDYGGDNTWGWTIADRKKIFLDDIGLRSDDVRGKILLDAGCGNGTLTAALATLGIQVIGTDLNDGLGQINSRKGQFAGEYARYVNFVQGNIFNPPFKESAFDLVYCSGVLHHTPNSRETFSKLVPLIKRGGRLYVWVYGRRNFIVRGFFNSGRQLKRLLSLESLLGVCGMAAPLYKATTELLNYLGIMSFRKRTVREITLDLFDAFAPQYNHWHTEDEVGGWFREMGFGNITVSGRQKHGFGVYGDKL